MSTHNKGFDADFRRYYNLLWNGQLYCWLSGTLQLENAIHWAGRKLGTKTLLFANIRGPSQFYVTLFIILKLWSGSVQNCRPKQSSFMSNPLKNVENDVVIIVYVDWHSRGFNASDSGYGFIRICSRRLKEPLWQKKKLLVTSNFSFCHNVSRCKIPYGVIVI